VDYCALIGMLFYLFIITPQRQHTLHYKHTKIKHTVKTQRRIYKKSLQNKAQYSSIIGNDNMKHKLQIMHQLRNLRTH